jgi:HTH-type transcriptional regulator / antitoxin HipB
MENIVNTSKQLGQALRQLRKAKGKTQEEVSATVGLFQKTVSALETSPERSEVGSLLKLISALELELVLRPKRHPEPDAW